VSEVVYEQDGIDVTIDPARVTAEEIARFAHDPRLHQLSMLEGDRFEILDVRTSPESELVGLALREMPLSCSLIGAIVRDGRPIFPRSGVALAGANFLALFRSLTQRRLRAALRDEELRLSVTVLVVAGAVVAAALWAQGPQEGEAAVRAGVFEVTSVVTTTGYFTVNYDHWPLFALMALALLFFVGGRC
jgi:hypothetical protein